MSTPLPAPSDLEVGTSVVFPAINPSPAPATIPISFISDPTVQAAQIVNPGGVLTGIPSNEVVSFGGQAQPIELPLPPLPTPVGARVSLPQSAYPMDYQTAGSNLLEAAAAYTAQVVTYNAAVATLQASGAYATYQAALAAFDAAQSTFITATTAYTSAVSTYNTASETWGAAYGAWLLAGSPGSGPAYVTYSAAGVVIVAAVAAWESAGSTYITALDAFDAYQETSGDPSPEVIFNAAVVAYIDAAGTYTATYAYNYENAYAQWIGAGSPGSGSTYTAWQAAQATLAAADATWAAATATCDAAIAAAVTAGTATYEASAAYITYTVAWGVVASAYATYVAAYNAAQSALNWWSTWAAAVRFWNGNRFAANPYSSVNPI